LVNHFTAEQMIKAVTNKRRQRRFQTALAGKDKHQVFSDNEAEKKLLVNL
jgi:hypothetical protein